jgi:DNA adenine methylase
MSNLLDALNDLDNITAEREKILRAPFGWPGGKSRSVKKILPLLPYRGRYCEVFGGTGIVLLNRHKSSLEIFNDRHSGITSFYRCLRNQKMFEALALWLDNTVHSREEWITCHDTWENIDDDIERAGRWFYMIQYSFAQLGRNFGRATSIKGCLAGKVRNKGKEFPELHDRLKNVQIENQDWRQILDDYDSEDMVWYIDPPYIETAAGTYTHMMSRDDHHELINRIFSLKGFVAVSGYSNHVYNKRPWDNIHVWDSYVSLTPQAFTKENAKTHQTSQRHYGEEILWIKE